MGNRTAVGYRDRGSKKCTVRSVTSNTRQDGEGFLVLAQRLGVLVTTTPDAFEHADLALRDLAGDTAPPVKPDADEPLDVSWAEPVVFDGCSSKGQARPGQAQPVHIVRKNDAAQGASS